MSKEQRYRCLTVGCNPKLYGDYARAKHQESTGHRTAKWPVRSAEGHRRARERNKNGYYDKYNVGSKSYENRFLRGNTTGFTYSHSAICGCDSCDEGYDEWEHPFSEEAFG